MSPRPGGDTPINRNSAFGIRHWTSVLILQLYGMGWFCRRTILQIRRVRLADLMAYQQRMEAEGEARQASHNVADQTRQRRSP